jgi:hypothetical protein
MKSTNCVVMVHGMAGAASLARGSIAALLRRKGRKE